MGWKLWISGECGLCVEDLEMTRLISLSDEECGELAALLNKEYSESRGEMRRTRNPAFRSGLEHHIEVIGNIKTMLAEESHQTT